MKRGKEKRKGEEKNEEKRRERDEKGCHYPEAPRGKDRKRQRLRRGSLEE
jgi:hypothetical protein